MDIPLDVMMGLKTMTRAQALAALARFNLSPEVQERYLRLTKPDEEASPQRSPRRLGMLVLWLLGGSYRDIGHLYSIAHQTVIDYIDKLMSRQERNKFRLQTRLAHESLVIYAREFNRRTELHHLAPMEIAKELLASTSVED